MDALLPNSRTQGGAEPGFGLRWPSSKASTGHWLAKVHVPDGPPTGPTETAGLRSPSSLGVWAGAPVRHSTLGLHIIASSLRLVGKRNWAPPKPHISGLGLTGKVCAPQGRQAPPSAQYRSRPEASPSSGGPHTDEALPLSQAPLAAALLCTLWRWGSRRCATVGRRGPSGRDDLVYTGARPIRRAATTPLPSGACAKQLHPYTLTTVDVHTQCGEWGARRTHRQLPARKSLFASLASQPCPRPSQGASSLWVYRVAAAMVFQREY